MSDTRPFTDLSDSGLLWLINKAVFHPRGYALALVVDEHGQATGWRLEGDGAEPWHFLGPLDDLGFAAAEATLAAARRREEPQP